MAIRKRFNPIDYYGGAGAAGKTISVAAPTGKYPKAQDVPLSTTGHFFDKLAPVIADAIKANREEGIRSADQANVRKMIEALTAPQTPFSTEKYGTSPEDLMVAAKGYDGSYDDDDGQILSSDNQREFYTEEAKAVEGAYNAGDPSGAALVRQQAAAGAYNMPDQRGFLGKLLGAEEKKKMGPASEATMLQILMGEKDKRDAVKERDETRRYQEDQNNAKFKRDLKIEEMKRSLKLTDDLGLEGVKAGYRKQASIDKAYLDAGLRPPSAGGRPATAGATSALQGASPAPMTLSDARAKQAADMAVAVATAKDRTLSNLNLPMAKNSYDSMMKTMDLAVPILRAGDGSPLRDEKGNLRPDMAKIHPGLPDVVGMPAYGGLTGKLPSWAGGGATWGSDAAGYQAIHDQITGKQFMEAYKTLKGGGQITEVEGAKATSALARMNTAQSEKDYIAGMLEFRNEVGNLWGLAQSRAAKGKPPPARAWSIERVR
jgi:hypothetical protein